MEPSPPLGSSLRTRCPCTRPQYLGPDDTYNSVPTEVSMYKYIPSDPSHQSLFPRSGECTRAVITSGPCSIPPYHATPHYMLALCSVVLGASVPGCTLRGALDTGWRADAAERVHQGRGPGRELQWPDLTTARRTIDGGRRGHSMSLLV